MKREQWEAGAALAGVFSDVSLLDDLGSKLTCIECDVLTKFLRAYGYDTAAEALLNAHAAEDTVGDNPEHLARKARTTCEKT